jgi:hypothetical protein
LHDREMAYDGDYKFSGIHVGYFNTSRQA